jgi:ABC-type polysaccharide/polyol phosphate export permease
LVVVFRDVAFAGRAGSPADWAIALAVGLVVWSLGTWVFSRYRDTLAESV